MRWRDRRRSSNIEDRRGQRPRRLPLKIGGLTLVVGVVAALLAGDPAALLRAIGGSTQGGGNAPAAPSSAEEDEMAEFVAVVLADTEDTWNAIFQQLGRQYEEPTLVLFTDAVQSACGYASSAVGPFYCPPDRQVYLDLGFFGELARRFGAPGDFAQAYVVAHEIGHHVQTLTGISERVRAQQAGLSEAQANALSVRQELQADCFAGLWAHHANRTRQILESGDVEEALGAATAIGDDTIQRRSRGHVVPESFTHGSATQRVRWFRRGLESGRFQDCDTFAAASP